MNEWMNEMMCELMGERTGRCMNGGTDGRKSGFGCMNAERGNAWFRCWVDK